MSEIDNLKRENEWLRLAISKKFGRATLTKWLESQSMYMQGMLAEREIWKKRINNENRSSDKSKLH